MRRYKIILLWAWTAGLIFWTLTTTPARYVLPPWRARVMTMRRKLDRLKQPPIGTFSSLGTNAQAAELRKQAQDLSEFIRTGPPPDSLEEAVSLLETTNRQAGLATSQQSLGFIWSGNSAELGQIPYQVGIVLSNYVPYAKRGYQCGGALIAATWVLTAGHCFQDDSEPRDVMVYAGHIKLSESNATDCNCWTSVKRLIRYPGYQLVPTPYGKILDGDVALLELNNAPGGLGLASIRTTNPMVEQDVLKSSLGTISGWGKSTANPNSLSDNLLFGTVKVTPDALCAKSYGAGIIRPDMICASPSPSDACAGDSGGPLVMKIGSGSSKLDYLEGVISWGYPLGGCPSTKPTVYSRVATFHDWIQSCISGGSCPSSIPLSVANIR